MSLMTHKWLFGGNVPDMQTSADNFLKKAYKELEFDTGAGYFHLSDPSSQPNFDQLSWYNQALELGAETIFFVSDYPTVLFFKIDVDIDADTETIEEEIRQLHLKTWNTGRVPVFFVALPGELRVYSAYQKPVRDKEEWRKTQRWLKQIKLITQVSELQEFSRPNIESGHLFQQMSKDFNRDNRVDQWLLKNLRTLRKKLDGENLKKREYVHALIGRSIFIRYLEDRKVLVEEYFSDKAMSKDGKNKCFTDVLKSKKDTYNLFYKLRDDFNADLFPLSEEEEKMIQVDDLHLLRGFLLGKSMEAQLDLFFWAYKFDIIPTELISTIYEEFYHEHGGEEDKGTHYTPTTLVDFVLSQCLTTARLNEGARVLDPACGSGLFIVEAFKRMVYHECIRRNVDRLPREELLKILTDRIVGVDINPAAIQVAAFSIYLAFLNFLEPRDIRKHKKLPKLVFDINQPDSGKNLFNADIFFLTQTEKAELQERLNRKKRYKDRIVDKYMRNQPVLPLKDFQFDVIIGNPPWGADDSSGNQLATKWCKVFKYPVGFIELSQCFIWRVRRLLSPGGEIGLLVSSGILFKHEDKSKSFREQWLKQNRIRAVYNFSHVRHVFFRKQKKEAIAPFVALFFSPSFTEKTDKNIQNTISYVSIKRCEFIEQLQAVIIDKTDLRKVRQSQLLANDWLWKTLIWGGARDIELIGELKTCYPPLTEISPDHGRGYQEGGGKKNKHTDELEVEFELQTDMFNKNLDFSELYIPIEPRKIHAIGQPKIFKGPRLLIKRGVSRSGLKFGEIQARLAYDPFAFRNSIIGVRLDSLSDEKRKIILGIVRSSLAKYYHFLTCSTWGFWHYEIHVEEHLSMPVRFPDNLNLQNRIIIAVEQITSTSKSTISSEIGYQKWHMMQNKLDEAVFDLYELSDAQRDLVRDLCQVKLEFFYNGVKSRASKPPTVDMLTQYCNAFKEVWHERLMSKGKELEARIYAPLNGRLCGMSFELKDLKTANSYNPITDNLEWKQWFGRLSKLLRKEYSAGIYIDRVVKQLSDSSMFIIKRAKQLFWTRSQAREDAYELLTEVFKLEWLRGETKIS